MDSITVYAPAKVNLFLKVLEKRLDGYHAIETIFEKISFFDKLTLRKLSGEIRVSSSDPGLPVDEKNLAFKAAKLVKKRLGLDSGIEINIEKHIPVGAGLGGGSSDAAAVLLGMDSMYGLKMDSSEKESIARELGADVPFFITDKAWAIGRERGDAIEVVDSAMTLWHMFVIPPFSIMSKDAYRWIDSVKKGDAADFNGMLDAIKVRDIEALGDHLYNDLENLSFERSGLLKELKDILIDSGAKGALISGSGPTLFGIFKGESEVIGSRKMIEERLAADREGWRIIVAPTLSN